MGRVDPIRDEHTLIAVKRVLKQMSLREWALFAFGISLASLLLFGLVPALHGTSFR